MERITKREFIKLFAERISVKRKLAGKRKCSVEEATEIYDCFFDTLIDELLEGNSVVFLNFGTFSVKLHKGQKIGFEEKKEGADSYKVVKFTTADILNQQIRYDTKDTCIKYPV